MIHAFSTKLISANDSLRQLDQSRVLIFKGLDEVVIRTDRPIPNSKIAFIPEVERSFRTN